VIKSHVGRFALPVRVTKLLLLLFNAQQRITASEILLLLKNVSKKNVPTNLSRALKMQNVRMPLKTAQMSALILFPAIPLVLPKRVISLLLTSGTVFSKMNAIKNSRFSRPSLWKTLESACTSTAMLRVKRAMMTGDVKKLLIFVIINAKMTITVGRNALMS